MPYVTGEHNMLRRALLGELNVAPLSSHGSGRSGIGILEFAV
jgi:hypothetical protein